MGNLYRVEAMPFLSVTRAHFQIHLRTLFLIVTIVSVQCAVCLPALREWQSLQKLRRIGLALHNYEGNSKKRYSVSTATVGNWCSAAVPIDKIAPDQPKKMVGNGTSRFEGERSDRQPRQIRSSS
jgi:hypothetical protein